MEADKTQRAVALESHAGTLGDTMGDLKDDSQAFQLINLGRYRRRLAKGFECILHFRIVDMCIDHRCGQVRMTEYLLGQPNLARLTIKVSGK